MDAQPSKQVPKRCVLLVEDVSAMRLYLRLGLERHDAEVIEAGDLKTARRLLRAGAQPTSVLLDLELPDGNGLDLMNELPRGVPVAALTADDSRETVLRCREAGCALVLCKSSKLGDLGSILDAIERSPKTAPAPTGSEPELARQYLAYLAETRLDLQQAARQRDFSSARRIAHRLRGTAVHFGFPGIGAGARVLGNALASGSTEQIDTALDALVERLVAAVEAHHAGSANAPALTG